MIPSRSIEKPWSLPEAINSQEENGSVIRDQRDIVSGLNYHGGLPGDLNISMENYSIKGLRLDRSVSAPPPNQDIARTQSDIVSNFKYCRA